MKKIVTVFVCICLALIFQFSAGAAPYSSYTYSKNNDGSITESAAPNAYLPSEIISGEDLGVKFNTPEDLFVDSDNNYYIVDSKSDTLYSFDKNFKLRYSIDATRQGEEKLYMPTGVAVHKGMIYVADGGNNRIAIYDALDGAYIRSITEITGDVLTKDFVFKPNKLAVSDNGSIYVVAQAALEGIIEISGEGQFYGYIGSNKTTVSAFELLWRRIFTEEQLNQISRVVPLEYHNVSLDANGFILTVTAASDVDVPVKCLNPSGDNVLLQGDMEIKGDYNDFSPSTFVDIESGKNGSYFILDSAHGRVFCYDKEGNLLYLFGDSNTNQFGSFQEPVAFAALDDKVLILDRSTKSITVFKETEYAKLISDALSFYDNGQYEEDYKLWQEVLKQNGNFDLAYEKAGFCKYRMHDYEAAMELFYKAGKSEQYSDAFVKYRQERASKNFLWIVLALAIVILIIAAFIFYRARKRQKIRIADAFYTPDSDEPFIKKNLKLAYNTMFKPSDNFWNIRFEKRGSALAAAMFVFLYFLVTLFNRQMRGFLFNSAYGTPMNLGYQLSLVLIPVVLIVISNWSVTTLIDGKGSIRDIFCVIGYSLLPLIIITPLLAVATQFFSLNELAYVGIIEGIAYLWTFVLILTGIKEVHQFSLGKTVLSLFLTVIAAAVILFICLLFFSLIQEIIGFVNSIIKEFSMR